MDIAVLQTLIAAGLFSVSLWWYRRDIGEKSGNAGRVLWVVFGIVSLVILAASGLEAVLLGGAVT